MSDPRLFVLENRPEHHETTNRNRGETLRRSKLRLSCDRPIYALREPGRIRDLLGLPHYPAEEYEKRSHYYGRERTWCRHNWHGSSEAVIDGRHYRVLLENQRGGQVSGGKNPPAPAGQA